MFWQSGIDSKWFLKKSFFKIGMWHSRPPRDPPSLHGKCHLKFPFCLFAHFPNKLLYLCFCHRSCGFVYVFVFRLFKFKVSPSPACCEQSHWWTPPSTPSCPRQHPTYTGSCFTGFKSISQQTKFLPLKSLEVLKVLSEGCQENTELAELEIVVTMLSAILKAE